MNAITTIAARHLAHVSASTCNTRFRSLAHPSRRGRTAWPPKAPGDAALSKDGKVLVLLEEHAMTFLDRKSGKTMKKIELKDRKLSSAVFSPDGSVLAVLQWDGTVGLWKVPP